MNSTDQPENSSLDHILKYTGLFGGVQGLNILISIIRNKLASKLLGAAGFGLMGFYMSVSEFVSSCSNMGLPISSVQHLSVLFEAGEKGRIRHFIKVLRTWCLWAALGSIFLCAAAALVYDPKIFLLAPMVCALLLTVAELSILKGLRRLKRVASITSLSAVTTLFLTIPFFWFFGLQGIIISLNCSTLAILLIHLSFTVPLYPWRVSPFSCEIFKEGLPLLRIGIPFVIRGISTAGAAVLLQGFLKDYSSEETLGFYRVGYTIMVSYAGIIFTALETDYFPRLSSINNDVRRYNAAVNLQARACLLLETPLLIALIVGMPLIIRMIYTEEFLPVVVMTVCAAYFMFFRCISVPIAYMALARSDSRLFMMMEIVYDCFSLVTTILCYLQWGLAGIGIGLSLSSVFDLVIVSIVYGGRYKIRLEPSTLTLALYQGFVLSLSVAACLLLPPQWKYLAGGLLFVMSVLKSYEVLRRESAIVQSLRHRLHI